MRTITIISTFVFTALVASAQPVYTQLPHQHRMLRKRSLRLLGIILDNTPGDTNALSPIPQDQLATLGVQINGIPNPANGITNGIPHLGIESPNAVVEDALFPKRAVTAGIVDNTLATTPPPPPIGDPGILADALDMEGRLRGMRVKRIVNTEIISGSVVPESTPTTPADGTILEVSDNVVTLGAYGPYGSSYHRAAQLLGGLRPRDA
ncbi:hypothetical protein FRB99_005189 [Tulasnella sp. 403]|nr:hypothetical protein FRB99_005189 [Tulasnella sp. 403]